MKRVVLIFLIFPLSHLTLAEDICFTTFEKDSATADVIFVGKVIDVDYSAYWINGTPRSIFTFEIIESFKGFNEYISVTSIMSPVKGCCRPHFKMDSTFLVFAFSFGGDYEQAYWTNDCTLTRLLSASGEFYNRLGKSLKPHGRRSDLERFHEQKAWLLKDEMIKKDSIKLIHSNLQYALAEARAVKSYLISLVIILVLILGLLTFLFYKRNSTK